MKSAIGILLFVLYSQVFALDFFLGMRNDRYGFAGLSFQNKFGVALENSLLIQKSSLQYIRGALFYQFETPYFISGSYTLFSGMRYNQDFYDIGTRLALQFQPFERFRLSGILQPFYDSDFGLNTAYFIAPEVRLLKDISAFVAFKNLPEYRHLERRFSLGLVLGTEHLNVKPEISKPLKKENRNALTRVSVSFIYKSF